MQTLRITLETGESLPLHDHPQTQVFMYVLRGALQVEFYSYENGDPGSHIIHLESSVKMGEGMYDLITEKGVNLHSMKAVEPTVFLDVMSPGYLQQDNLTPAWFEKYESEGLLKVREISMPENVAKAKELALAHFEKETLLSD